MLCFSLTLPSVKCQKGPIYASGAGGLPSPPAKSAGSGKPPAEEGVQREETETIKTVGNEFVRVVTGSVGYESPEGLPVFIK